MVVPETMGVIPMGSSKNWLILMTFSRTPGVLRIFKETMVGYHIIFKDNFLKPKGLYSPIFRDIFQKLRKFYSWIFKDILAKLQELHKWFFKF